MSDPSRMLDIISERDAAQAEVEQLKANLDVHWDKICTLESRLQEAEELLELSDLGCDAEDIGDECPICEHLKKWRKHE